MKKPSAANAAHVNDLYQQVTDRMVAAIEKGTLPWRRPWRSPVKSAVSPVPVNACTGRGYQGINVLLLWLSADERGFTADRWLTYRQTLDAGGQVRRGETGSLAVLYKPLEYPQKDTDDNLQFDAHGRLVMAHRTMIRSLFLFNVAQCDGLPASVMGPQPALLSAKSGDTAVTPATHQILRMLDATGVKARSFRQRHAYYHPQTDEIVMPAADQFFTDSDYWSTLLHELVHATGHQKRLNREGITSSSRHFGDPVYAFEELIAEMGSAFLCATLGVYGEVHHDSYISHWLSILKADKKALFRACRFSREAAEYLLHPLNVSVTQTRHSG
jgi:antirestriction protein ArdC